MKVSPSQSYASRAYSALRSMVNFVINYLFPAKAPKARTDKKAIMTDLRQPSAKEPQSAKKMKALRAVARSASKPKTAPLVIAQRKLMVVLTKRGFAVKEIEKQKRIVENQYRHASQIENSEDQPKNSPAQEALKIAQLEKEKLDQEIKKLEKLIAKLAKEKKKAIIQTRGQPIVVLGPGSEVQGLATPLS